MIPWICSFVWNIYLEYIDDSMDLFIRLKLLFRIHRWFHGIRFKPTNKSWNFKLNHFMDNAYDIYRGKDFINVPYENIKSKKAPKWNNEKDTYIIKDVLYFLAFIWICYFLLMWKMIARFMCSMNSTSTQILIKYSRNSKWKQREIV